ncbi:hypothetical protein [Silvimonas iriomotensis]|uniref:Uncharacterized protein n=1 Tax=Silvimonas iriomotensis TaxID=449662 RepID=A0ABQ2PA44_9NEIS|nr:hypothetical protein [Silvimonas iriomotensis]GGP22100.1 hypothetical protein GCM10010970_23550 [Silvimonas iriomotensis]
MTTPILADLYRTAKALSVSGGKSEEIADSLALFIDAAGDAGNEDLLVEAIDLAALTLGFERR